MSYPNAYMCVIKREYDKLISIVIATSETEAIEYLEAKFPGYHIGVEGSCCTSQLGSMCHYGVPL